MYFNYNEHINKKVKLLGVDLQEFLFVVVLFAVMLVVGGFINSMVGGHWLLTLLTFATPVVAMRGLRWANRKGHPSFLFSFMSYRLFQPKKIRPVSSTILFRKKT
jgi:uncharacterized membrane protein YjjP (DUF1212 family)